MDPDQVPLIHHVHDLAPEVVAVLEIGLTGTVVVVIAVLCMTTEISETGTDEEEIAIGIITEGEEE